MNHYLREDNSFSQRREHSLSAKRKQYLRGEKNYSPYKMSFLDADWQMITYSQQLLQTLQFTFCKLKSAIKHQFSLCIQDKNSWKTFYTAIFEQARALSNAINRSATESMPTWRCPSPSRYTAPSYPSPSGPR